MFPPRLKQGQCSQAVEWFFLVGALGAFARARWRLLMRFQQGIHHHLPRSSGDGLIARGKIREGKLRVKGGLILRFVLGVEEPQGFRANRSLQTFLLSRYVVLRVETAACGPSIQSEPLLHSFSVAMRLRRRVPSQLASSGRVVPKPR